MANLTLSDTIRQMYEMSLVGVDPLIDTWPLMRSPIPMVIIVTSYLLFVKYFGPKWMENRKAFDLRNVMLVYNALQVVLCTYIVSRIAAVDDFIGWIFSFGCKYNVDAHRDVAVLVWVGTYWYWMAKLLDLLDTVFFVLRKKSGQISFLHVYHHTLMASMSWCYLKYMPAETGVFVGVVNSSVHIVMYIYYGLSAIPSLRKYLWWKRYITWIQLTQFGMVVAYMTWSIFFSCIYHRFLTYLLLFNGLVFIYLFSEFYRKTYLKRKMSQAAALSVKQKAN